MNAHTPGPWTVRHLTGFPIQIATKPDEFGFGVPIADCCTTNSEANARLIAAAPELLEALQALIKEPNGVSWRQAHDAIAKATKGVTA